MENPTQQAPKAEPISKKNPSIVENSPSLPEKIQSSQLQFTAFRESLQSVGSIRETGAKDDDAGEKGYITRYQYGYGKGQGEDHPFRNVVFLFGDNLSDANRVGGSRASGGQANLVNDLQNDVGENANAVGIITTSVEHLSDDQFKELLKQQLGPVKEFIKAGGRVVYPAQQNGEHNLGTGIAHLSKTRQGFIKEAIEDLKKTGESITPKNLDDRELTQAKQKMNQALLQVRQRRRESKDGLGLENKVDDVKDSITTNRSKPITPIAEAKPQTKKAASATASEMPIPKVAAEKFQLPEGVDAKQVQQQMARIAPNADFITHETCERKIKTDSKRKDSYSQLREFIDKSNENKESNIVSFLRSTLEKFNEDKNDSAFAALHQTIADVLNVVDLDDETKLSIVKIIMDKFDFISQEPVTKQSELENISTAFENLKKEDSFKDARLSKIIENNYNKFFDPLKKEAQDIVSQLEEEEKEEKKNKPRGEEADMMEDDLKPFNKTERKNSKQEESLLEKSKKFNKEIDQDTREKTKAAIAGAKYLAAGAAIVTVTAFFPPAGLALLIAAAVFCAYKSLKEKPIKDYQPMTNEGEPNLDENAMREANMDSNEFLQSKLEALRKNKCDELEEEATKVADDLNAAKEKLEEATKIANENELPNIKSEEITEENSLAALPLPNLESALAAEAEDELDLGNKTALPNEGPIYDVASSPESPDNEGYITIEESPEISPVANVHELDDEEEVIYDIASSSESQDPQESQDNEKDKNSTSWADRIEKGREDGAKQDKSRS